MKKPITCLLLSAFCIHFLAAQATDTIPIKPMVPQKRVVEYPFWLYDSHVAQSSMRKTTTNYNTLCRLMYGTIDKNVKDDKLKPIYQFSLLLVQSYLGAFIHEEGHRSVLNYEGIGSISSPFPDAFGVATVRGVTDMTLKNLRDTKLPTYIRLHTAGIESDYLAVRQLRNQLAFDEDSFFAIFPQLYVENSNIVGYYATSLLAGLQPNIKEDANELKNDIVGHDVYGAIKNLHRPKENFYRYTRYEDLTADELKYMKKAAFSSLLNVLGPSFLSVRNDKGKFSFGMGYTMTPFGSMYEQGIWMQLHRLPFGIHTYFREYDNKNAIGFGAGCLLRNVKITKNMALDIDNQFFNQPLDMDFNTKTFKTGFASELQLKYYIQKITDIPMVLNMAVRYKTKGFVLGEPSLQESWNFSFGGAFLMEYKTNPKKPFAKTGFVGMNF
jgi:hypothetical protein